MFARLRLKDWIGVAFGAWLFVSPWTVGYADDTTATVNAMTVGSVLVMVELLELGAHQAADEWIYVVAGSWLMFSPLVLGMHDATGAVNAMVAGAVMAGYTIASMARELSQEWRGGRADG